MRDKSLMVQRIPKCYVGDGCVQIMIPFRKSIVICERELLLTREYVNCSYNVDDKDVIVINKYLEDDRRHKFPYSNIPLHASRNGIKKIYKVNQLLNFNEDYYCIVDDELYKEAFDGYSQCMGYLTHLYLLRDNDDVLLVSQCYSLEFYSVDDYSKEILSTRKYTLEEIKGLTPTRICASKEPKISSILSPNIKKEEIVKAKKMVRSLNKK